MMYLGLDECLKLEEFISLLLHYTEVLEDGGVVDPSMTSEEVCDGRGVTACLGED